MTVMSSFATSTSTKQPLTPTVGGENDDEDEDDDNATPSPYAIDLEDVREAASRIGEGGKERDKQRRIFISFRCPCHDRTDFLSSLFFANAFDDPPFFPLFAQNPENSP